MESLSQKWCVLNREEEQKLEGGGPITGVAIAKATIKFAIGYTASKKTEQLLDKAWDKVTGK